VRVIIADQNDVSFKVSQTDCSLRYDKRSNSGKRVWLV